MALGSNCGIHRRGVYSYLDRCFKHSTFSFPPFRFSFFALNGSITLNGHCSCSFFRLWFVPLAATTALALLLKLEIPLRRLPQRRRGHCGVEEGVLEGTLHHDHLRPLMRTRLSCGSVGSPEPRRQSRAASCSAKPAGGGLEEAKVFGGLLVRTNPNCFGVEMTAPSYKRLFFSLFLLIAFATCLRNEHVQRFEHPQELLDVPAHEASTLGIEATPRALQ